MKSGRKTPWKRGNVSWAMLLMVCALGLMAAEVPRSLQEDDDDVDILEGAADGDMNGEGTSQDQGDDAQALKEVESLKNQLHKSSANVPKTTRDEDSEWETEDIRNRYERGLYKLEIDSIFPRGGPVYGTTRVTVRAAGIGELVDAFPDPKCRFGRNDAIVEATYIKCSKAPKTFYQKEKGEVPANETCIQCEASPKLEGPDLVSLSVSLTGRFDDVYSSQPYRYYNPVHVDAIYPRYGPKDGDTVVQVWGKNFLDLGDDFRCNFGTRSTKANFINENYIWCRAAPSDVVDRPMPFSVSLNRQQNSLQKLDYWYYNDPRIAKISPDYGPLSGGTKVTLRGSGFLPFDWREDINNQNDTFCSWGPLGKTPAAVLSSTEAECLAPENNMGLKIDTPQVNLTLNNQNYTDEAVKFYFYNPPKIIDAEPLRGPVKGGTEVNLWGTQYQKNKNITCFFGKKNVTAKYVSKSHLVCKAPNQNEPGDYKLVVKYENDRFQSDVLSYTYFANPEVADLSPACGPISGYTQITVRGKNFVEQGFGLAKCIFNGTYHMNATVLDANTMVCDTPPLETVSGDKWYNISVTLDGDYVSNATGRFSYYEQPQIESVSPWLGPMIGNTDSVITGKGFKQDNICDLKVRYGKRHLVPRDVTKNQLTVTSPEAQVPGQVVVSISGNNQQFIDDKTLHFRDKESTFEYYQNFYVEKVSPVYVSNSGNSPVKLKGMLFDQFKHDNGTHRDVQMQCRFVDIGANSVIREARNMTKISDNELKCVAPKTDMVGDARIEVSPNGQQWQDIDYPVKFFSGPKVTAVTPTYGVTKNPRGLKMEISGENFACPNNDCSKTKVRFTNQNGDQIFVDGRLSDNGNVVCEIPKYPAPETLNVDVSFNDQDYTNDGVKFGFLDPYVLGISPRLLSTHGTTKLNLQGYGFVQMEDEKSQVAYKHNSQMLTCNAVDCKKTYKVVDEHTATVETYEQAVMMKESGAKNIGFDPVHLELMDPDGDYMKNDIALWFYKDPVFSNVSSSFAYANENKPLLFNTQFFWNEGNTVEHFRKHSDFKCRFTSTSDPSKVIVTDAIMETNPIGQYKHDAKPDQVRCRTPKWNATDSANVDISVNGQDYLGKFPIEFVDSLDIYKIAPLSGPIGGSTKVKLYGSGFTAANSHDAPLFVKFGTIQADSIEKSQVTDYAFSDEEYHQSFNIPASLLTKAEENDPKLAEG